MTSRSKVGIKELKNRLSAYLRLVRRGRHIVVTDREEVVAEIRPARPNRETGAAILTRWAAAGIVLLPSRRKQALPDSPVSARDGTAREILEELRGE